MKKYLFGVDIGGTTIKCGLFTSVGTVLDKWEIVTNKADAGKHILPDVARTITAKCKELGIHHDDIKGVGVGVPGPVTDEGAVLVGVNINWSSATPVKTILKALLKVPVTVANDANAAALGELWLGAAKGAKNAVMFTLGTGVGGGIITHGKVIVGTNGAGGEIGHMPVVTTDGSLCNCGKFGCLETVASATGIVRTTINYLSQSKATSTLRSFDEIVAKDVFDAALTGDLVALKMVDQLGFYLGLAAAQIASVVDPEKIIIGGGVARAGAILLDSIKKHYLEHAFASVRGAEFVIAKLGNDAGIIGAAYMAKTEGA